MDIITLAAATLLSNATAPVYVGAGFVIPDNTPAGGSSSVNVAEAGNLVSVKVTLTGLVHTWVGDLTATLTNSNGTASIFAQIGRVNTGFGDSSNFNGNYTFDDASNNDIWAAAAGGGTDFVVPPGTYFASGANAATKVLMFTNLQGNVNGNWTLKIVDAAASDTGDLVSWSLDFEYVPAPGALALLGLAGLAGRRRRD